MTNTNTQHENIFSVIDTKSGQTLTPEQIRDKNQNLENAMVSFDIHKVKGLVQKLVTTYGDNISFGKAISEELTKMNELFKQPNPNRILLVNQLANLNSGNDLDKMNNRNLLLKGMGLSSLSTIVEKKASSTIMPPVKISENSDIQKVSLPTSKTGGEFTGLLNSGDIVKNAYNPTKRVNDALINAGI